MSDVEYEEGDVNRVDADDDDGDTTRGALSKAVLEYVAKAIVDDPDSVEVDADEGRRGVELSLHVSPDDMGKVIGKRGRVAQAIRSVVRAAGAAEGVETNVDIVD
jgi:predicted RNA-binding protein YlqC (UPF0109 family)